MSTLWSATRATAISSILSALSAYIYTDDTGAKRVKRAELKQYLHDQFLVTIAAEAMQPTQATNSFGPVLMSECEKFVENLAKAIEPEALSKRSNWPTSSSTSASNKDAQVSQIDKLQVQAAQIGQEITSYFDLKKQEAIAYMEDYFDQSILPRFPDGVTVIEETRAYFFTYVTDRGEESAPSAASALVTLDQNDTVQVTITVTAEPGYSMNGNVSHWRLYRTSAGRTSSAFQLVAEIPIGTLTYTDSVAQENLGEVCPTTSWTPPRLNMSGLCGMPNGIQMGFYDRTLCPSEAYVPYAFPREYEVPLEFPIVGLAVFGQMVFVGTRGNPYFAGGADPASITASKLADNQACISKRSIATTSAGVVYASPDGLCLATPSGVEVISAAAFTKDDWMALNPATSFGVEHDNVYYLFHDAGCYTFDLESKQISTINVTASAAFVDRVTDTIYTVSGTSISALFGGATPRTGIWKSKIFRFPSAQSIAWLHIDGDFTSPVTVRIYVDSSASVWATYTVSNGAPVRVKAGRYVEWQIEVESTSQWTTLVLASDTDSLKEVV